MDADIRGNSAGFRQVTLPADLIPVTPGSNLGEVNVVYFFWIGIFDFVL
jgi:hypothetical protein